MVDTKLERQLQPGFVCVCVCVCVCVYFSELIV